MVCLGLKPRAAGWKAQTNPLSYSGTDVAYSSLAGRVNIRTLDLSRFELSEEMQ